MHSQESCSPSYILIYVQFLLCLVELLVLPMVVLFHSTPGLHVLLIFLFVVCDSMNISLFINIILLGAFSPALKFDNSIVSEIVKRTLVDRPLDHKLYMDCGTIKGDLGEFYSNICLT